MVWLVTCLVGPPPRIDAEDTTQKKDGIPVVLLNLFTITCFGVIRNRKRLGFLALSKRKPNSFRSKQDWPSPPQVKHKNSDK